MTRFLWNNWTGYTGAVTAKIGAPYFDGGCEV